MVLAAFSVIIPAAVDVTVLSLETSIAADSIVLGRRNWQNLCQKSSWQLAPLGRIGKKVDVTEKGAAWCLESKVNLQYIDAGRCMRTYQ